MANRDAENLHSWPEGGDPGFGGDCVRTIEQLDLDQKLILG